MKKTIKIKYVGWWDTFDYRRLLIHQILEKYYEVQICSNPDYIFCSHFSLEFLNYDCIRIFYTAENLTPDFNLFDYAIGFDDFSFGDRYVRVPNYVMNLKYTDDIKLMSKRQNIIEIDAEKRFCGYVCSNGEANPMRDLIFDKLSEYKKVDSGGKYRNNIAKPNGVTNKLKFQKKYKFALALENTSFKGYITEKLIEAYAAGGIPIYWGAPDIEKYFNKYSFVNIMDYSTLEDALGFIKRLDQDDELYKSYLNVPALVDVKHIEQVKLELEQFLLHIFEPPLEFASRRSKGNWPLIIENCIKGLNSNDKEFPSFWNKCKKHIKNIVVKE